MRLSSELQQAQQHVYIEGNLTTSVRTSVTAMTLPGVSMLLNRYSAVAMHPEVLADSCVAYLA